MGRQSTSGKPTTRRYTPEEKAQAVRLVRQLRKELGTAQGTVGRVAEQLGYGVESVRGGCDGWVGPIFLNRERNGRLNEQGLRPTTSGSAYVLPELPIRRWRRAGARSAQPAQMHRCGRPVGRGQPRVRGGHCGDGRRYR